MAGDWIKVEASTPSKPEIDALADILNVSVNEVIGGLIRLWIWADQQTLDGNAASVTKNAIDRHSGVSGFTDALLSPGVRWLKEHENGGFVFPNFSRHNGQTAKQRALTAKRVAESKKRKGNAASVTSALPREEKRREYKKDPLKSPTGDESVFDRFWESVHLKTGKEAARRAHSKAVARVAKQRGITKQQAADAICEAMALFAASPRAQPKDHSPIHPATWLNQGCYDDDPTAWDDRTPARRRINLDDYQPQEVGHS